MNRVKEQFSTPILVLVGPTAVGKTALSLRIAQEFGFEIISMDSMQVYRFMDIGTAKATIAERQQVPHYLIDIVDPDDSYDAACFRRDALASINEIIGRGKLPLITGGTGLYLERLLHGIFAEIPSDNNIRKNLKEQLDTLGNEKLHQKLAQFDKASAERIHPNDTQRLLRAHEIWEITGKPWSKHLQQQAVQHQEERARFPYLLQIGLTRSRERLYQRINKRSMLMLQAGLEEEVRSLLDRGISPDLQSMQSIGYRHINEYFAGKYDKERMLELLARDTRHYAKRQYTWFNKNKEIEWVNVEEEENIISTIGQWLRGAGR